MDVRTGHINVIQEVEGKLIQITVPRDEMRIISVGPIRPNQVKNLLGKGDFVPLPWIFGGLVASIHIEEIQKILFAQGNKDSLLDQDNGEGYFLDIRFDSSTRKASAIVDEEYKDKVITLDCPYGTVVILCDEEGQLKSIELS